jgi:hypothetical protein
MKGHAGFPIAILAAALAAAAPAAAAPAAPPPAAVPPAAAPDAERARADARAAFLLAYNVFLHPRCMNCHPAGDRPLQGDDSRPHGQNVRRGSDGRGVTALRCANCHQDANQPGEHMPPGNPAWHLPPPRAPMVFEGRTPAELARQLKDPERNGGKTLDQILRHVAGDALVKWGWDPGDGRAKPPMTHADFVQAMRAWIDGGAPIPE